MLLDTMFPIRFGVVFIFAFASALCYAAEAPAQPAPQTQSPQPHPSTPPAAPAPASAKHTITVNFNYDFSKTPSCSATVTKSCVQQFIVYDISAGAKSRYKLFSVPAPPGQTVPVKGITGKSPLLSFEPGKHKLGVTAQMSNGKESFVEASTTWVEIPPPEKQPAAPPK
jgi:hypothetical protein